MSAAAAAVALLDSASSWSNDVVARRGAVGLNALDGWILSEPLDVHVLQALERVDGSADGANQRDPVFVVP